MSRLLSAPVLLVACALSAAACGSSATQAPTAPTPVALTETFDGQLNRNGAATFQFIVQTAGTVAATLTTFDAGDITRVGLSLGTWNGAACQVVIANDAAHPVLADGTAATTVIGTAAAVGSFCVRIYDVGQLTDASRAAYTITVTHF